jgi:hypothetical protein
MAITYKEIVRNYGLSAKIARRCWITPKGQKIETGEKTVSCPFPA